MRAWLASACRLEDDHVMTSSNKVRHLLEVVLQLLAVRNNAFIVPATSWVHIYEVLNSLADGTTPLCGDGACLWMAQNFLMKREIDNQLSDLVLMTSCTRGVGRRKTGRKAERQNRRGFQEFSLTFIFWQCRDLQSLPSTHDDACTNNVKCRSMACCLCRLCSSVSVGGASTAVTAIARNGWTCTLAPCIP